MIAFAEISLSVPCPGFSGYAALLTTRIQDRCG
jgi:hypothetical protein